MPIPTELFATITGYLAPDGGPGSAADAARVWRALFKKFGPLLGPLSTDLLFARCLAAHAAAFPWLPQSVPGAARSSFQQFQEFERSLDGRTPEEIASANQALLSTYMSALAELIGMRLTIQFLQAAFPHDEPNKNT